MQNSSTQPFNTTIQPLVTFYSRLSNHEVAFDDEWKPQLVSLIWNKKINKKNMTLSVSSIVTV